MHHGCRDTGCCSISQHSTSLNIKMSAVPARSMTSRKVWLAGLLALLIIAPCRTSGGQQRPLTESDLLRLLSGGVYCGRVAMLVRERGISFSPTKRDVNLLQKAGANEELERAVIAAREVSPVTDKNAADAKPLIIWHRVNGHLHWHCVAHCSKYRGYHTKP